jgi:hypothetical protein
MLDKGRATLNGKNGEYHYNCPLDQRLLGYLGVDAEALKKELAAGKGDGEILEWIETNGWVSAEQLRFTPPLAHLYAYLLASNFLVPVRIPAESPDDANHSVPMREDGPAVGEVCGA